MEKTEMIFITGNARSGTTMMGRILGKSPSVFTFPELHFFEQLWSPSESRESISREGAEVLYARLLKLNKDGFFSNNGYHGYMEESAAEIKHGIEVGINLQKLEVFKWFLTNESHKNNKEIACEQTPRNLLYIEEILKAYPQARIINMVRDPRDVLLSQKNKWKRRFLGARQIPFRESIRSWINYHPITISRIWRMNVKSTLKHRDNPRVLFVKFEEFLNYPESGLKRICEFLGIEFYEEMLEVARVGSSVGKDSGHLTGVDQSRIGQWNTGNLNRAEISLCQKICEEEMDSLDYKKEPINANPFGLGLYSLSFPLKLSMALIINLNRMKNPMEAIKRRLKA